MMAFLCALPVIAGLFSPCAPPPPLAVGYVEGEYVLLAPLDVAELIALGVRRGEKVAAGQVVARLEDRDARIAVDNAAAALLQAEAELANLKLGKRPEEIAVLDAALTSAEAEQDQAKLLFDRQADLLKRGVTAQAGFDQASTDLAMARAKVAQQKASLAVARLPARAEEIVAAENRVKQARAALKHADWRLEKRTLNAPAAGEINDVIRRPGEVAGPTAPVLSLLPEGATKLKVYVREEALASLAVGAVLAVRCDGCGAGLRARISYISADPEFTPPVIYSLESRQKLVYLVEARPEPGATMLKPGQIVDVDLGSTAK
jgi:HlyD family secretion protein